jgi:hypothetical protein
MFTGAVVGFEDLLLIFGGYAIVQVLAQDMGMKTGKRQRDFVQSEPFTFLFLLAGSFTLLRRSDLALYSVFLYYFLKYIYSGGVTSDVCFEEV